MTPAHSRSPLAPLGVLATFTALLAAAAGIGRGQAPAGRQNDAPVVNRTFVDAVTCIQCHKDGPPAQPEGAPERLPQLVLQTESRTWEGEDKHRHAFDALVGDRGKKMGELLGFADVSAERACLSCHATGFERDDPELDLAVESRGLGVGCTSCHGPYQEWTRQHFSGLSADPKWREMTPEDKSKNFGMTDLRDPAVRAQVCSSCHVGNAAEGKVVTHTMYAAGHPPLPAFEVASFLKTMPPHWMKPRDVEAYQEPGKAAAKPAPKAAEKAAAKATPKDAEKVAAKAAAKAAARKLAAERLRKYHHVDFSEPQATKSVVLGGVAALRGAMRLLADRAEPGPEALPKSGKNWPDYAQFECYACHHDLKTPDPEPGQDRGRQARGFDHHFDGLVVRGVPGRPQFRPWPLALARLALAEAGEKGRAEFRDAVKELYAAFDARPFGDPARVQRAATRLADWADEMIASLRTTRFDPKSPRKLLAVLAATPAAEVSDFDTARQVAWAFQEIYSDLGPRPGTGGAIDKALAELNESLKLDPYASRAPRAQLISTKAKAGDALRDALLDLSEGEFKTSIARASNFDPEAFQATLKRLGGLLSENQGQ